MYFNLKKLIKKIKIYKEDCFVHKCDSGDGFTLTSNNYKEVLYGKSIINYLNDLIKKGVIKSWEKINNDKDDYLYAIEFNIKNIK